MTTPRSLSESIDELQRLAAEQAAREASTRAAGQATIEQVARLIWTHGAPAAAGPQHTLMWWMSAARAVVLWAADADPATLAAAATVAREEAGQ